MTKPLPIEIAETLQTGHDLLAAWKRRYEMSQWALARALREAHVMGECLEMAIKALRWYDDDITNCRVAYDAVVRIEQRLAQLEGDDETTK